MHKIFYWIGVYTFCVCLDRGVKAAIDKWEEEQEKEERKKKEEEKKKKQEEERRNRSVNLSTHTVGNPVNRIGF